MKDSYSLNGQDRRVLEFYRAKKNGFYIEVGAYDGIKYSNTYILEKREKWNGICGEPQQGAYQRLIKRRSAICDPRALYSESGLKLMFSDTSSGLSGLIDHIDYYERVKKNPYQYEVTTVTLTDLLTEHQAPSHIDYFSLDTEGSEMEVLKGIDFNRFRFGYLNIEHNDLEERRMAMRKCLLENNYLWAGKNTVDDIYIHRCMLEGKYVVENDHRTVQITATGENRLEAEFSDGEKWTGFFDDHQAVHWESGLIGKLSYREIEYPERIWIRIEKPETA